MNIIADITGGDSFSDIYGMRRFTVGFLRKWLVMSFNKDLIMLPQTYGPFNRALAKTMARYILNHAGLVYSRDRCGVEYVNKLLNHYNNKKVQFAPDIAFVLDPHKPNDFDISSLSKLIDTSATVVGLNISGLLFNGRYKRDNIFNLKSDYRKLIDKLIDRLMERNDISIVLIPHVFPSAHREDESDPIACLKVYELSKAKYKNRLLLVDGKYNQNEIKYIIGTCDFVIGSRMHACIAALSQHIPAVGIAYSDKFSGVFESINLAECVVDARNSDENEVIEKVKAAFENKNRIRNHLVEVMPQIKNNVLTLLSRYKSNNNNWL